MGREWQWCRSLAGAGEHQGESSSTTPGCMSGMLHYFDFHHLILFSAAGSRKCSPDRQPSSQTPAIDFTPDQLKGLEAPRNSLELDERKAATASAIDEDLSDIPIGIEVLTNPSPSIILTNKSKKNMLMLLEEERKTSSQVETPRSSNIVARLMGLEVLPDEASSTSPAAANSTKTPPPLQSMVGQQQQKLPQKKSPKKMINFAGDQTRKPAAHRQPLQSLNCNTSGSRSLPESPRVSSSRSCDGDPRLSLQINKENSNFKIVHEFNSVDLPTTHSSLPPSPSTTPKFRRKESLFKLQDENRSTPKNHCTDHELPIPSKDRGRRFGDHHQAGAKSKRTPVEKKVICESNVQNETSKSLIDPSSSSATTQIRFSEAQKSKPESYGDRVLKPTPLPKPPLSVSSDQLKLETPKDQSEVKKEKVVVVQKKCMKASNERFTERIKKPSSHSLSTLASLFQSPPISITSALPDRKQASKNLKWSSNFTTVTTSGRKEAPPPPSRPSPATQEKELTGNSNLRSSRIQKIEQVQKQVIEPDLPEYRYVKSIFEHTDPTLRWYSTSLPIDPIIFHQIELEIELDEKKDQCKLLRGTLQYKWNRKLLFHLVEELLGDFLLGWSSKLPAAAAAPVDEAATHLVGRERKKLFFLSQDATTSGEEPWLLQRLWARIRSFPAANCRVLADIDALVSGDLAEANTRRLLHHPAVVEEADHVVSVVGQEILHDLLDDATVLMTAAATSTTRSISHGRRSMT